MRIIVVTLCILFLSMSPISTDLTLSTSTRTEYQISLQSASAEPVLLSMIGIAVGLAGIASDIYGMSEQSDLSTQVADKVKQVTTKQIQLGLSPLKNINPKLKKLLSNQKLLVAGQKRLLAGQQQLMAGQQKLMVKLLALTEAIKLEHDETRHLLKQIQQKNLAEHQKTQALVMGLQDAKYSAALRLIDLAGKAAQSNEQQAQEWLQQALNSLLETQAYFIQREHAGVYVSREYQALVHLSLATCYLGLNLPQEGIKEIARLVAIPSAGKGLDELLFLKQTMKQTSHQTQNLDIPHIFHEIYAWSRSLSDERMRLQKLKTMAVSTIKTNAKLARLWASQDNEAFGQALLAERELAIQAFATAVAKHQTEGSQVTSETHTSRAVHTSSKPKVNTNQVAQDLDIYRAEELATLKRAAKALGDTKELTKLIKKLARSSDTPSKVQVKAARESLQRVSAEVNLKGTLVADLKSCVERGHFERIKDCKGGLAFLGDVREVLKNIDFALDRIESIVH